MVKSGDLLHILMSLGYPGCSLELKAAIDECLKDTKSARFILYLCDVARVNIELNKLYDPIPFSSNVEKDCNEQKIPSQAVQNIKIIETIKEFDSTYGALYPASDKVHGVVVTHQCVCEDLSSVLKKIRRFLSQIAAGFGEEVDGTVMVYCQTEDQLARMLRHFLNYDSNTNHRLMEEVDSAQSAVSLKILNVARNKETTTRLNYVTEAIENVKAGNYKRRRNLPKKIPIATVEKEVSKVVAKAMDGEQISMAAHRKVISDMNEQSHRLRVIEVGLFETIHTLNTTVMFLGHLAEFIPKLAICFLISVTVILAIAVPQEMIDVVSASEMVHQMLSDAIKVKKSK
ncbi:unnamed protein product [Soboliphyme baturini]|uniref:AIG1-type G domain-containing protein n=1 Tax=Soboliphyme baturini TaxID=241478 RepID=A0A183IFK5_9BILA|nr:unnamed protein product [Soboliphyme baturini]